MIRSAFFGSYWRFLRGQFKFVALPAALFLGTFVSSSQAQLTHRYSFTTNANDSVGSANGTLVNTATVSGGQLQLNNPNFSGPSTAGGYLSLPPSILPSSGSVTIESWFTFTGSGFFTEDWTFSDNANDTNSPGANNGQYFMHTISAPQGGPNAGSAGGSHVAQRWLATLAGKRMPLRRHLGLAPVAADIWTMVQHICPRQ